MPDSIIEHTTRAVGQFFLEALTVQDFEQMEALFAPHVRFRALLPPRICEESTAEAATGWLRRWFGDADSVQVLEATASLTFDRLYLRYRLRTHDARHGWRVIEQQAYGNVQEGRIVDMWLLCSGFRPDPAGKTVQPGQEPGAFCTVHSAQGGMS